MTWLEGRRLLDYKAAPLEDRNPIARAMFRAWWYPFSHYGVIHGDPHLGNYTIFEETGAPAGINLLDYGCIRTFPTPFVQGVIDLYNGLLQRRPRARRARLRDVGLQGPHQRADRRHEHLGAVHLRAAAGGPRAQPSRRAPTPGEYGRKEAFTVHKVLKEKGPVTVPREFVFMDRAAIGLGGVFLHLDARHELVPPVQRDDRGLRARGRRPSASARHSRPPACRCRHRAFVGCMSAKARNAPLCVDGSVVHFGLTPSCTLRREKFTLTHDPAFPLSPLSPARYYPALNSIHAGAAIARRRIVGIGLQVGTGGDAAVGFEARLGHQVKLLEREALKRQG